MMRVRVVVRNTALLCLASAVGWWGRGAERVVLAGSSSASSPSSGGPLEFQLSSGGPQASLTVYNPSNHTLYVYPRVGQGNSHISCEYSLTVANAGAAIDRENCPVGEQVR